MSLGILQSDRNKFWYDRNKLRYKRFLIHNEHVNLGACILARQYTVNFLKVKYAYCGLMRSWWRHQMETFSALLVLCAGTLPASGEFISQRPVTQSFDVFFDLRLNKRLSKQSWCWWFQTPSCSLWRHCKNPLWTSLYMLGKWEYIIWHYQRSSGTCPIRNKLCTRDWVISVYVLFTT